MPRIQYTHRIIDLPKTIQGIATLLREQGMLVDDECHAISPAYLSSADHINGAGVRTYFWDSGEQNTRYRQLPNATIGLSTSTSGSIISSSVAGATSYAWHSITQKQKENTIKENTIKVLEEVKIEDLTIQRKVRVTD